jgi:hypothetical protein
MLPPASPPSNYVTCLGRSPHLIPPIIPDTLPQNGAVSTEKQCASELLSQISNDVNEAKDNLLQAKIFQAHHANDHCSPEVPFSECDQVRLSMMHCQQEYKKLSEKCVAKFFPCFDGPYTIIKAHPQCSRST